MTSMGQRVIGCVCIIVSPWCFVHATTACHTWCNTIHSKRSSVAGPAVLPITICLLLIQIHMSIQRPMQHAFAVQCLDGDSQISFSSRWIRLRYALSNGPATVTQWINSYWANVQNWCFIMFHCTVFLCLTIHRCSNSSWVLGIHWHTSPKLDSQIGHNFYNLQFNRSNRGASLTIYVCGYTSMKPFKSASWPSVSKIWPTVKLIL